MARINSGAVLDFPRHSFQPGFLIIGSSVEAVVSFMIGKIEIIGVILSNSRDRIAETTIPADKINGISEVIPVSSPVTGNALILLPSFVHSLLIAISRGRSRTWKKTKTGSPGRFCLGFEF